MTRPLGWLRQVTDGWRIATDPNWRPLLEQFRDHGLTTWGAAPDAALNYVELFEYIFGYMAAAPRPADSASAPSSSDASAAMAYCRVPSITCVR